MIRNTIFWAVILMLVSCGNKNNISPGILKPDKMQVVLWDIIRAEAFSSQYIKANNIEENAKLQKRVFAMHQVNKEAFYQSFNYYRSHTALMKTILDSMINKAGRETNIGINPTTPTQQPTQQLVK